MLSPNKCLMALGSAALLTLSTPVLAGRSCEEAGVSPTVTARAFDAGAQLQSWLNSTDAKVVLVARRGQDLSKYGQVYSHVGFALKDAAKGTWVFYHELNTCGTNKSLLYEQGLADFFADDLVSSEVAIVTPQPWLQSRLTELLTTPQELHRMHEPQYSAVAYPFAAKYQNSNGWVLETFARAAADYPLRSRNQAQQWLKQDGYQPDLVHLGTLTRLGGRLFRANVAFDDHPPELRWSGKITVNSADGLLRYVSKYGVINPGCTTATLPKAVCVR